MGSMANLCKPSGSKLLPIDCWSGTRDAKSAAQCCIHFHQNRKTTEVTECDPEWTAHSPTAAGLNDSSGEEKGTTLEGPNCQVIAGRRLSQGCLWKIKIAKHWIRTMQLRADHRFGFPPSKTWNLLLNNYCGEPELRLQRSSSQNFPSTQAQEPQRSHLGSGGLSPVQQDQDLLQLASTGPSYILSCDVWTNWNITNQKWFRLLSPSASRPATWTPQVVQIRYNEWCDYPCPSKKMTDPTFPMFLVLGPPEVPMPKQKKHQHSYRTHDLLG